jgi:ATP/maltotriose-dependent transcriptional regulator MalT
VLAHVAWGLSNREIADELVVISDVTVKSQALRTSTHHETVHTGKAGAALQRAGHLVIPATCAQLEELLGR